MPEQALLPLDHLNAEFTSNNMVRIKYKTETGSIIKTIGFNDYCEAIIAARENIVIKEKSEAIITDSPIFPVFGDVTTIQHRTVSTGAEWFVLVREAGQFNINYYDTIFKNVGIPKLLFAVRLLKNVIQRVHIVCIKDHIVTKDTLVYCFPFSNVSAMNGDVCFGANRIASFDIKEPLMLHSLPAMFLSMGANDHSYGNNLSGLAHRKILEALENKPFPEEWLKPMVKNYSDHGQKTYSEWINQLH